MSTPFDRLKRSQAHVQSRLSAPPGSDARGPGEMPRFSAKYSDDVDPGILAHEFHVLK